MFQNDHDPSKLLAETPCKLLRFLVPDGSHVEANTPYAEVEVMKMCMPLLLPASGVIHFLLTEGQPMQVMPIWYFSGIFLESLQKVAFIISTVIILPNILIEGWWFDCQSGSWRPLSCQKGRAVYWSISKAGATDSFIWKSSPEICRKPRCSTYDTRRLWTWHWQSIG